MVIDETNKANKDIPEPTSGNKGQTNSTEEYFIESNRLQEELRETDPERYEASQHWVNNPLITSVNKMDMLASHEKGLLSIERARILKAIEDNTTVIINPRGDAEVRSLRLTVEDLRSIVEGTL
jgi:hypothetical protein